MPEPDTALLHEWLRRTAAASPSGAAIIEEDRVTTFAELLESASGVAAWLREQGVQPGDRVALVLPKTTDAVVAVFGCLLAGAIYVPIHPRWPADRIEAVVADCGAKVVIDEVHDAPRLAPRSGGSLSCPSQGDDPAFILFTSGSTGRPKGVVISHRAVAAFVRWSAREFRIGPADRIACPSPLGFDLSTFDLFNMALCGAACVVVPEQIAWMPRLLVRFAEEQRITCWYSVPSILAHMLRDGGMNPRTSRNLRAILFAGEVFPSADLALLLAAVPRAVCANLYGPTETNVVTFYRVPQNFDCSRPVPIGRACPFATVTTDSFTGELLAGGESLMTGYWNRPDDTARAFVTVDGRRHYQTGDRGRLDESGEFVFLGRLDRQIKRRGYRIELGEIEDALSRHAAILEVGVVATANWRGETLITAVLRTRAAGDLSLVETKAHCARTLPPYMVPDHVLFVEAVPGEPGKIDYPALEKLAAEMGQHGN